MKIKTYGFDHVKMTKHLTLEELDQLQKQVKELHANEFKDGKYFENGTQTISQIDKKGQKKLDQISWAIYNKTKSVGGAA